MGRGVQLNPESPDVGSLGGELPEREDRMVGDDRGTYAVRPEWVVGFHDWFYWLDSLNSDC